jgi:hypothetical protein
MGGSGVVIDCDLFGRVDPSPVLSPAEDRGEKRADGLAPRMKRVLLDGEKTYEGHPFQNSLEHRQRAATEINSASRTTFMPAAIAPSRLPP